MVPGKKIKKTHYYYKVHIEVHRGEEVNQQLLKDRIKESIIKYFNQNYLELPDIKNIQVSRQY